MIATHNEQTILRLMEQYKNSDTDHLDASKFCFAKKNRKLVFCTVVGLGRPSEPFVVERKFRNPKIRSLWGGGDYVPVFVEKSAGEQTDACRRAASERSDF